MLARFSIRQLRFGILAAVVLVLFNGTSARAEQSPGQFVSSLGDRVVAVLQETQDDERRRRAELRDIFLEAFDVDFIGQFVLGRFWRRASDSQKEDFMAVLPEYVATIYAGLFAGYEGDGFKVTREIEDGDSTLVEGVIRSTNGPDVAAAFTITRPDSRYLIKNASVEGVSLLVAKRSEFASVITREGIDGLIKRIRQVLQS